VTPKSLFSSSILAVGLLVAGSASCLAGGGYSYSPAVIGANGLPCPPMTGAVNPFVGTGGRDYVAPAMVSWPTTTLCHTCGVPNNGPSPAIFQPRPASIQNATLVGGIANTQQTGGSVTGGNVNIGGASAAAGASGVWGGWGHHGGGGSTPSATSSTNAVVNYTNTNQTTNTTTNNISDSFNTTVNTTINKTYNIDNSSTVNFNFFVLGNSNAINTGSGSSVISDSGNGVGNTGGSSGGGRRPHRGIWNSSGMTTSEGGSSGGDVGDAS